MKTKSQIAKPFTTNIDPMDQNLYYFPVHIECRYTNVSMDPLLVEQLVNIFGSQTKARAWISQVAGQISTLRSTNKNAIKFSNAGLSRLVCREAWRMIISPDGGHLQDIRSVGGSHPLSQEVSPGRKINAAIKPLQSTTIDLIMSLSQCVLENCMNTQNSDLLRKPMR
ncbi:hypothetical protein FEMY_21830 [Ferrovum myxofaciens]|uniref:Uncharacterized protein n=1 Tax=Ferrovum myxofaciens TaxID=416213 RepID=A0A149VVN5_9PROT|nr:hypothetical protein [Ferrovum myxofaciens]KXW57291.1 hypothetical protein FEMY_21830 [Ferrovum myxofaciens]